MGTLGGGNGGDRPPEGGGAREGLPGLPPEWGTVVIPDDPSELAEEAADLRRELRRHDRWNRRRTRLGLPARQHREEPSIALPLLIMGIAVIATLTSLFAVAWPRPQHHAATADRPTPLPDLVLTDATGQPVHVRDESPAVILLVDECDCDEMLAETITVAPAGVAILVVGHSVPQVTPSSATNGPSAPGRVRALADPGDRLRASLSLPAPTAGMASVMVVSRAGEVILLVRATRTAADFRTSLAALR